MDVSSRGCTFTSLDKLILESCFLKVHPFKTRMPLGAIIWRFQLRFQRNLIIHMAKAWHYARMGGTFLRTFFTERTGIRVNPDVVQKLEINIEQHLAESSGVSSVQEYQKQKVTTCSTLPVWFDQSVHQNRRVGWRMFEASRFTDSIHCRFGFVSLVSLVLQKPESPLGTTEIIKQRAVTRRILTTCKLSRHMG